MRSSMEIYKGKMIFCVRYDHLTLDELRVEVAEVKKEMLAHAIGEQSVLVDITGTIISPAVLEIFKDMAAMAGQYRPRAAVLGITGARRYLMEIIAKFSKRDVMPFDDAVKAKDWLVS